MGNMGRAVPDSYRANPACEGVITPLAHVERTIWTRDTMAPVLITGAMEYDLTGGRGE